METHRRTEIMTYNPTFDFGAVYTNTQIVEQMFRRSVRSTYIHRVLQRKCVYNHCIEW